LQTPHNAPPSLDRPPLGLDVIYGQQSPVAEVAPQVTVLLGSMLALYITQSLLHELSLIL